MRLLQRVRPQIRIGVLLRAALRASSADSRPSASRPRSGSTAYRPPNAFWTWWSDRSTTAMRICDKQEAGQRAGGRSQPRPNDVASRRHECMEKGAIPFDIATCGVGIGKDNDPANRNGLPAEPFLAELGPNEPFLLVELAPHLFDRRELALDLDDQRNSQTRMQCQDVDRAPLTVDGVRHLDGNRPSEATQDLDRGPNEARMALVEEAIQGSATPADVPLEASVHRSEHESDCRDREAA
jgi:hypothetical protein